MIIVVAACALPSVGGRAGSAGMDGLIMRSGKVLMMKGGKATDPISAAVKMSNGAVVAPDGGVRLADGRRLRLRDGQMVMMDGEIMDGGKPKAKMRPEGASGNE
jgi:hypothetical protein